MIDKKFDIVVLGGGPGGYVAAIRASQLGLSVALVEKEHLGGICLNWGCIPTKAMLKSAEVFDTLNKASDYGVKAENVSFDLSKIVDRSKKIASQLSSGVKHLLHKNKVEVINGLGVLENKNTIVVDNDGHKRSISTSSVIIATGARAREIEGLESDGNLIWNYKHALRPSRMPKNMLVVGSGAIGVEFASFYNSLGCKITVIELLDRILPNEDNDIAVYAKKEFELKGIKIIENTKIKQIRKSNENVAVDFESSGNITTDDFDTIIMATGIVGNIEEIGLDVLGIKVEKSHIETDKFCETNVENIYAIGDVSGAPWLAHKASHEGVIVAEKISGLIVKPIEDNTIAGCTFCSPQIASVGLTEEKAVEAGWKIKVGRFPFSANGKALAIGESGGFVKTIFDSETGELLGAHMVGPEVTELIHSFVLGKKLEGTDEDFFETIFPHPTLSEALHESSLNSDKRTIHF
jgi:dihydrolipoamide dehydrogenase